MFLVEKGDLTFLQLFLRNHTLYLNLHDCLILYPNLNPIEVVRSVDQIGSIHHHISCLRGGKI